MDKKRHSEIKKIMQERKVSFVRAEEILEEEKTNESFRKLFKK